MKNSLFIADWSSVANWGSSRSDRTLISLVHSGVFISGWDQAHVCGARHWMLVSPIKGRPCLMGASPFILRWDNSQLGRK